MQIPVKCTGTSASQNTSAHEGMLTCENALLCVHNNSAFFVVRRHPLLLSPYYALFSRKLKEKDILSWVGYIKMGSFKIMLLGVLLDKMSRNTSACGETQAVCCFVSCRYESSAAEYKSTLEEAFKMEAKKSHQDEQKAKDVSSPSNAVTAFLVNEVQLKMSTFHLQCVGVLQFDC